MKFLRFNLLKVCLFVASSLLFTAPGAHAETPEARAILNAQEVKAALHSVLPEAFETVLVKIAKKELERISPTDQLIIVEIIEGKVLLNELNPATNGTFVSELVDDAGNQIGLSMVNFGKKSRSGWLGLQKENSAYRGFCSSQYPFVVCSFLTNPVSSKK